jgi:type I restriction enzyme S subunit
MNAAHQLLTAHIDIWAAADTVKKSGRGRRAGNAGGVYGIKKMRELILELAVRGKLVPQDPRNEPASELLKRIQAEKTNLIAEGKIKENKSLPPITEEEKPFKVPQGWEKVRFGEIIELVSGQHLNPSEYFENPKNGSIPYITGPADFGGEGPVPTRHTCERRALSIRGDILVTVKGSGVGKTNTVSQKELAISRQLMAVRPIIVDANYIEIVLVTLAKLFQELTVGIAIPGISREDILHSVIEIPPLAEQHRIVAKVDELMALCDQLETQHTNAFDAHEKLVSHLLATLTRSQDAEDFSANWQRIAAHFDALFTTEASIDALKQTLLQLAVMGKLVPQDPNDEPASELLKRIQTAKAKLIDEGKIKKEKPLLPITDEEKPFELPQGWEWVKLGAALDITGGVTLGRKLTGVDFVELPYLRVANVQRGHLVLDNIKTVEIRQSELSRYQLSKDDLLVTEGGDWDKVGRTAVWNSEIEPCLHQNHIFRMRGLIKGLSSSWIEMYMNSIAKAYFQAASKQTTNLASINMTQLKNCLLAVPAIQEQHRIVAKVDELMELCDQLKTRITEASQLQQKLANVMVEQAVA